jgi:hypothetical protein
MTNRFMMSVAAVALIAGTGFANAQGTGMSREAPSAGSTVQQSAPSSGAGTSANQTNRDAAEPTKPSSGMKATESDQKQPGAAKNQRAEDKDNMQGQKSKSMSSDNDSAKGGSKEMKAEGRNGNMNAEQKGAADSKSQTTTQSQTGQTSQPQTTGQAGAAAKLSTEQRTKITTVIRDQHVQPVTSVNFSIAVGTRVPRDVSFHPLPAEVVTVYPEWRGYEFILVNNQILVVNPRTLEIVAILEA